MFPQQTPGDIGLQINVTTCRFMQLMVLSQRLKDVRQPYIHTMSTVVKKSFPDYLLSPTKFIVVKRNSKVLQCLSRKPASK